MKKLLICSILVFVSACSTGPGDERDLQEILELSDGFTTGQAECVSSGVFEEYGGNDQAISFISSESFDELLEIESAQAAELEIAQNSGDPEAVDNVATFLIGFEEFYSGLTNSCLS